MRAQCMVALKAFKLGEGGGGEESSGGAKYGLCPWMSGPSERCGVTVLTQEIGF